MMTTNQTPRRGFTLIELLIVIGCMMILIGMISGGVMMLMRYQLKTDTVRLVDQFTAALSVYLDQEILDYTNKLEDPPTKVLDYLYKIPAVPFLEPAAIFWNNGNINKTLGNDSLCDAWGNSLQYEHWTLDPTTKALATQTSSTGWDYKQALYQNIPNIDPPRKVSYLDDGNVIRSKAASVTSGRDDLIWLYTIDSGWRRIQ